MTSVQETEWVGTHTGSVEQVRSASLHLVDNFARFKHLLKHILVEAAALGDCF